MINPCSIWGDRLSRYDPPSRPCTQPYLRVNVTCEGQLSFPNEPFVSKMKGGLEKAKKYSPTKDLSEFPKCLMNYINCKHTLMALRKLGKYFILERRTWNSQCFQHLKCQFRFLNTTWRSCHKIDLYQHLKPEFDLITFQWLSPMSSNEHVHV